MSSIAANPIRTSTAEKKVKYDPWIHISICKQSWFIACLYGRYFCFQGQHMLEGSKTIILKKMLRISLEYTFILLSLLQANAEETLFFWTE